ncbi:basic salivary proline-rich protein 4-like [Ammospiza nelsoni]|uniref:basic salivary proline-rich protein 4-like n=1 Tax=Ammospiza nelsoni TaxID=2857394 RepID=UPI00286AC253|nr:basic salivary proline-rich protein 4-like [Ammospiza nelsoni]
MRYRHLLEENHHPTTPQPDPHATTHAAPQLPKNRQPQLDSPSRRPAQSHAVLGAGPSGGLKPLPGLKSARDSKALATAYRAAPVPKASGGSFSPVPGRSPLTGRAPHTGCQLKGAQRLPDPQPAYRPVHTQGATELGLPPRQQEPDSRVRHSSSRPKAEGPPAQPRGQGGHTPSPMTPGPTPLKDRGQGHPPDYRGSLQPPAEARGRTEPHLRGRPLLPGTPQQAYGAQALACAPLGQAGARPQRSTATQPSAEPREPPLRGRQPRGASPKQGQRRERALRHGTSASCPLARARERSFLLPG